jgi:hypothetical protein
MPPRISPVGSNQSALSASAILGLPPASANDGTVLPAVQTYDAVGRIVLGQTNSKGTAGSYVRIRASAGGAILNSATVGNGATSLTVINKGSDAETFAIEIEAWLELVVTAATISMLSSATINDIGADNVNNVFARFATPTSAAEAVTQRAYVFETNDPSLTFYEATPQTVYGAGTASCNGEVTFYDVQSSLPAFVYAGSVDPSDTGILNSGGDWVIRLGTDTVYSITSAAASPSLATGTWTLGTGTAPAPTVLGVTYDVEVASRVTWPIQSAVITISPATFLAGGQIPLVDAPAAGYFLQFVSAFGYLDYNTTPYSVGDAWAIYQGDEAVSESCGDDFISQTSDTAAVANPRGDVTAYARQTVSPEGFVFWNEGAPNVDGDSTITLKVYYRVHALPPV